MDATGIGDALGLYKAEWLDAKLFDLFTEPGYFGGLKTFRPCVLIGGRGTGKTTVLRGLSYEGQLALSNDRSKSVADWDFFGIYYRVNTNRVTAFCGPEMSETAWQRSFSHYLNLTLCSSLLNFATWYEGQVGSQIDGDHSSINAFRTTLGLEDHGNDIKTLSRQVNDLLLNFEASINTIADAKPSFLSMLAAPVDCLVAALRATPSFTGRHFFFLVDEFENFQDYQQVVLNTVIKHASAGYTFKIGVRELGKV